MGFPSGNAKSRHDLVPRETRPDIKPPFSLQDGLCPQDQIQTCRSSAFSRVSSESGIMHRRSPYPLMSRVARLLPELDAARGECPVAPLAFSLILSNLLSTPIIACFCSSNLWSSLYSPFKVTRHENDPSIPAGTRGSCSSSKHPYPCRPSRPLVAFPHLGHLSSLVTC